MKIAKWNEKVSAKLDDLCVKNTVRFCNREDGVAFCDKYGTYLLFAPSMHVCTYHGDKAEVSALSRYWDAVQNSEAKLAESSVSGYLMNGGISSKVRRFTSGDVEVYVQERFLRIFPKNTMFYVESPVKPIIAGIWENDRLTIIGIVMPIRKMSEFQIAA